jgi:hypothetical protein
MQPPTGVGGRRASSVRSRRPLIQRRCERDWKAWAGASGFDVDAFVATGGDTSRAISFRRSTPFLTESHKANVRTDMRNTVYSSHEMAIRRTEIRAPHGGCHCSVRRIICWSSLRWHRRETMPQQATVSRKGGAVVSGLPNHNTPFVDGTPGLRGSGSIAWRSARAAALKMPSTR